MKIPIYQVDAFSEKIFNGNPAAVCPLNKWPDDEILQNIAAENNLSETAFYVNEKGNIHIRWFTPSVEVDLCGHATLAAAHVLFNHFNYPGMQIIFQSKSGELRVKRQSDRLLLNFPSREPYPVDADEMLVEGLGLEPKEVFKSRDILAVVDEQELRELNPDFGKLKKLDCLGVIVTSVSEQFDFVSRFFAPAAGINEDPVTGSAHSTLIPFWAKRLNKTKLMAKQISKRGGILYCEYLGDRVLIGGKAVTFLTGEIEV